MDSSEQSSDLPRKQLRFKETVSIRKIPHVCEYSLRELNDLWIQQSDMDVLREHFLTTIHMVLRKELLVDSDEYCIRGTEIGVPEIIEPRRQLRSAARQAVVEEYALQKAERKFDAEMLRVVSRRYSVRCGTEAHHQGLQDFEDAMESMGNKKLFADRRPSSAGRLPSKHQRRRLFERLSRESPPSRVEKRRVVMPKKHLSKESSQPSQPSPHGVGQLVAFYDNASSPTRCKKYWQPNSMPIGALEI
jgi:hypothetical protein